MMEDRSGQPRSDQDLQEAIDVINAIMVKHPLVLPILTVHAMDIKDCLLELQGHRKLIAELKRKKEGFVFNSLKEKSE